jgi:protein arginine kinase activator
MASPLKCDLCTKPATVHLTQIVDGKASKLDLCEACAQAKGVTDPGGFSLGDLLQKAALTPGPAAGLRCEQCGATAGDFKKHGRFGCAHCYDTFAVLLAPMLENMHKGVTHTGKVPQKALARKSLYDHLTRLESELGDAIKSERYEDAARYRDEIQQVKQSVPATPPARQP